MTRASSLPCAKASMYVLSAVTASFCVTSPLFTSTISALYGPRVPVATKSLVACADLSVWGAGVSACSAVLVSPAASEADLSACGAGLPACMASISRIFLRSSSISRRRSGSCSAAFAARISSRFLAMPRSISGLLAFWASSARRLSSACSRLRSVSPDCCMSSSILSCRFIPSSRLACMFASMAACSCSLMAERAARAEGAGQTASRAKISVTAYSFIAFLR